MPTLSDLLRVRKDPRLFLYFGNQNPRPPRNRLYIDLEGGLRILLELPDLLRVSTVPISHGPCRLSVYQAGRRDFELRSLRVCGSPIDLARDGGDGDAEIVIADEGVQPW
jgi:hypothetical protein